MELMRHEAIETTMKYYVGRNAEATAEVLYAALDPKTALVPKLVPKTRLLSENPDTTTHNNPREKQVFRG